ncbi:LuxR C-terminal-related transcriptional regulator [Eggerthella timonensis]|uniref:LuxR C-terminal-related transcriptional regulator n=1 Tax=Eggerthella timonensis TaxID=1871008 RepID=UPI0015E0C8CF|nr:LuxR C-terminal-related transcriptional regulator [Eggerthella timonensis]
MGNTETGASKRNSALGFFRLLGFGYFQAWVYFAALNPVMFSRSSFYETESPYIMLMLSGFLCASILMLVLINAAKPIFENPSFLFASSLVAGLGTLLMGFASSSDLHLTIAGIMLVDVGTAALMMYWGKFWSIINTDRMSLHLIASSLFAVVLYVVFAALPAETLVAAIAVLPLASALTLMRCSNEPRRRPDEHATVAPSIWKLLSGIVTIPIAYSLMRALFLQDSLALFGESYRNVMAAFAGFAIIMAFIVLGRGKPFIGRMYRFTLTLVLFSLVSLFALPDSFKWLVSAAMMLGYSIFCELVWLMQPEIEIKLGKRDLKLFGWNRIVVHASAFAGIVVGNWLLGQSWLTDSAATAGCMLMTLLVVTVAVNALSEQDFMSFVDPIKVEQTDTRPIASETDLTTNCERLAAEYGLSKRELDVLMLLARGRSLPYIEEQLFISNSTVRTHTRNIYRKLNVHTRQTLLSLVESRIS